MAIRIPGLQGTFGLEPYYLDETTGWMPGPTDSAERQLADGKAATDAIADGQVVPIAAAVGDTGPIHTAHQDIQDGIAAHADRAASDTAGANNLRGDDQISGQFGAGDQAVGSVAGSLGNAPGIDIGIPPAPQFPAIDTSPWQHDDKNV
jgi:hypothetical protein